MRRTSRVLFAVAVAAMAATCGGPVAPSGQSAVQSPLQGALTVASLALAGRTFFVQAGQTSQLTATAKMSDGTTQDVGARASWQSSNTAVATVSGTGLVTSRAFGVADISALYQGVAGRSAVSVTRTGPPVVDQQFSLPTNSSTYGGYGLAAQSFTVGIPGALTGADLNVSICGVATCSPTDILVQLFATSGGFPTGSALSEGTIPKARIPIATALKMPLTHVDFSPVVPVSSGELLAIVFSWPPVIINGVGQQTGSAEVKRNGEALYSQGQALHFVEPATARLYGIPEGWTAFARAPPSPDFLDADFEFRTYVGPVTP